MYVCKCIVTLPKEEIRVGVATNVLKILVVNVLLNVETVSVNTVYVPIALYIRF